MQQPRAYLFTLLNQLCNISSIVLFALGTRDVVASAATAINMLGPAVSTLVFRDPLSPLRRWAVVSSSALSFFVSRRGGVPLRRQKRGATAQRNRKKEKH